VRSPRTFLAVACALLLFRATPVFADAASGPGGDWLELAAADAAELCPDDGQFAAKVEKHLGRSPAKAAAESRRRFVARIYRLPDDPSTWSADLEIRDKAGHVVGKRSLSKSGETCQTIADALALITALTLSNLALSEPVSPAPPPLQPVAAAASAPEPGNPSLDRARPVRPHRLAVAVDGGLAVAAGLLPRLAAGGGGRVLVAPPGWPAFYVSFDAWPEQRRLLSPDQGAVLGVWTLGSGVCWLRLPSSNWAYGFCAGADLRRLHASGFGFSGPEASQRWLVDLVASGHVQVRLARGLYSTFGLQLLVPLTRGEIDYQSATGQAQEMWKSWPVSAVGFLHVGYKFW
jgi:hypothetical protein